MNSKQTSYACSPQIADTHTDKNTYIYTDARNYNYLGEIIKQTLQKPRTGEQKSIR